MAPLLDLFVRWLRPVTLALLLVAVPAAAPLPAYGKVVAVATTGMIADAVRAVGGELVEVHGLMGPGSTPTFIRRLKVTCVAWPRRISSFTTA